ncbi:MAG: protease complex subunit PrcB family protein [Gammaproteobacteria bacterium]|nr:protease complex subunit PrcB family protein [Gammaproteobacteria bacterium]
MPLESGSQSGVAERSFLVVGDVRTFRTLYASVHAHRMPSPRPPDVDFEAHVVLLAFLGARSTGGHRTGFGILAVEGGVARVPVVEQSPPAGALLTQAMTTPYAMATLARANLHTVELVDGTGAVVLRGSLR